jgi:predicted lipoprotein with Yx(FWY)xxD motif
VRIYGLLRNAQSVGWKAFAAVATAMAARGVESLRVLWSDVVRTVDENGMALYHFTFDRAKKATSNSKECETTICVCALGVAAIDDYISLFPEKDKEKHKASRFWRRLYDNKKGGVAQATWKAQALGKNTTTKCGQAIATALGLEHPELYTGHC